MEHMHERSDEGLDPAKVYTLEVENISVPFPDRAYTKRGGCNHM